MWIHLIMSFDCLVFVWPLCVQALEANGMDVEIDLSNLGTVNTMFAALFRLYFEALLPILLLLQTFTWIFVKSSANLVFLSKQQSQLLFLKKLSMEQLQSGLFLQEHQLVERCFYLIPFRILVCFFFFNSYIPFLSSAG